MHNIYADTEQHFVFAQINASICRSVKTILVKLEVIMECFRGVQWFRPAYWSSIFHNLNVVF